MVSTHADVSSIQADCMHGGPTYRLTWFCWTSIKWFKWTWWTHGCMHALPLHCRQNT